MTPVPVIHVITKLELGGAQQNTLYTVGTLDRSRFRPVLVAGAGGYLMAAAEELDVPLWVVPELVREIRPVTDVAAYRRLRGLIRPYAAGPAIVHTHSSKAGIVGRWAARRAGCPVVIHSIHGFGHTPVQPAPLRETLKLAERATARITDHFIAVSEANRQEGMAMGLFGAGKCALIRSGFDLGAFRAARADRRRLQEEFGIPASAPVVLMVGNLKPQKNPRDFLQVALKVSAHVPEAHFILTGEGELEQEVRAQADSSGLATRFHLPGWREDIPALMKSCQVVALTSLWEGLPRVIPQAKAAGRPVVANGVDGCVEAVRDGVDGYLVRPGDTDTMAARIRELLADPARAGEMGAAGSRSVEEFDQDTMVRRQEELYERLLVEKGLWK